MRYRTPVPYGYYLRSDQETGLSFEVSYESSTSHDIRSTPTSQPLSTVTRKEAWLVIHERGYINDEPASADRGAVAQIGAWAEFVWPVFAFYSVPIKSSPR